MSKTLMQNKPKLKNILISVLNWNSAPSTILCVNTLLNQISPDQTKAEIWVIDNASEEADFRHLAQRLDGRIKLVRNEKNLGFASGHNVSIREAMRTNCQFVWLCNNDAVFDDPETLQKLVALMALNDNCGAASPMLANKNGKIYFSGGTHDWSRQLSLWDSQKSECVLQPRAEFERWVSGAAMLLRIHALCEVGILNERYFAYYEDNELCAKLAAKGWTSKVSFEACVVHPVPANDSLRASYYFYFMQRNFLLFWTENTPQKFRRFLHLKLLDQAFFESNKLLADGHTSHSDACLLGIFDFLVGKTGAPDLTRRTPFSLRIVRALLLFKHRGVLRRMRAGAVA